MSTPLTRILRIALAAILAFCLAPSEAFADADVSPISGYVKPEDAVAPCSEKPFSSSSKALLASGSSALESIEERGVAVASVSMGEVHAVAVGADGSLWAWGSNSWGELGDGSVEDRYEPVRVMDDVVAADVGAYHTAAIKSDGSLWMWGANSSGQIGDGTTEDRHEPVKVMDDVKDVSLEFYYSAAVRSDGSLWTWGYNDDGQLGDGTTEDRNEPVKVMDDVSSVSLGGMHTATVKNDGTLWTWGSNAYGRLCDDSGIGRYEPAKVMNNVVSVSAGSSETAVVKTDGSLWMWGDNSYGQHGNGTTEDVKGPTKIMDNVSEAVAGHSAYAITSDGSLWAWGNNYRGQLGDGTTEDRYEPAKVMDGVSSFSWSSSSSAAVKSDGTLWTWGDNTGGVLGDSSVSPVGQRSVPGQIFLKSPSPEEPDEKPWQAPDALTALAASELAAFVTSGGDEGVLGQSSILREITNSDLSEWLAAASFYDRPVWEGHDVTRCDLIDQELGSACVLEYSFSPNYVAIEQGNGCLIAFGNHRGMDLKAPDEHLDNALRIYAKYASIYGAENVFVTGSEYGGSLAAYVCTVAGSRGSVFNSSGAGYDTALINNYLDLAGYSGVDGIECTHYYTPTYYEERLSSGILGLRDAMDSFWSYPSVSIADNGLSEDPSDLCSMYSHADGSFSLNDRLRKEGARASSRFSLEPAALFSTLASAVQGKPDLSLFSKSVVLSLGTSGPDSFSSVWTDSENWFTQLALMGDAGDGVDRAKTGNWNDIVVSGEGDSNLNGGWGGDLYVIGGKSGTVTIDDYTCTGLQSGVNLKKFFDIGKDFSDSDDVAWDGMKGTYKLWKLLDEEGLFQKDRIFLPHAALGELAVSEDGGYYVIGFGNSKIKVNKSRLLGQDFEVIDKNGDKASLAGLAKGKTASAPNAVGIPYDNSETVVASIAIKGARTASVREVGGNVLLELDSNEPREHREDYGYFVSSGNGSFEFEYDASRIEVSFEGGEVTDCHLASIGTESAVLRCASATQNADLGDGTLHAVFGSAKPELVLYDEKGAAESLELDENEISSRPAEDIGAAEADAIDSQAYTGSPVEPRINLRLSGVDLTEGTDYDLEYEGNVDAGTAYAVAKGMGRYGGSKTVEFEIAPASLEHAVVEPEAVSFPFTGSPVEPAVKVTLDGKELSQGVDFETSYGGNVEIGAAIVTVTGIGNYTGSASATFQIEAATSNPESATVSRLGGSDRYETMALVSQAAFPEASSCDTIIVARGDSFPDALAAAGLAGIEDGQVLLTNTAYLTEATKTEIERLGAAKAFVVGDENAVSSKAFGEISALVGGNAVRLGGSDRYDTALEIYKAGRSWGDTAIVALGTKPSDALSASPIAYGKKAPIFLATADGSLTADTLESIKTGGFETVLVMGSVHSVSEATEEALSNVAETVRFSGSDRYDTSRLTAEWALENGFSCSNPVLVAGRDGKYTDALVSSSLSGGNASPLLLVDDGEAADLQIGKILVPNKGDVRQAYVIGDEWSVSAGLYAAVNTALK